MSYIQTLRDKSCSDFFYIKKNAQLFLMKICVGQGQQGLNYFGKVLSKTIEVWS